MQQHQAHPSFPFRPHSSPCGLLVALSVFVPLLLLPGLAPAAPAVPVQVHHVGFDRQAQAPVVILADAETARFLPIWVGPFEARAIALALAGTPAPRPLTHDLMKNVLDHVGVRFQKVIVSALKNNTYFARIHLLFTDRPVEIDSRPSDAIALALRFDRPIFVAQDVFAESGQRLPVPLQPISATVMGIEVQNLTVDLAEYFQLPTADGVLVTNSTQSRGTLQRGDVILALEGELIRNISDFRKKTGQENQSVRLLVRRSGQDIGVILPRR